MSVINLVLLNESAKDPFSVCQTEVGSNAIFCDGCLCRIQAFRTSLLHDPDFRCA